MGYKDCDDYKAMMKSCVAKRIKTRREKYGGTWGGRGKGRPANTPDVLWSKVDKRGPNECWPWLGYISDKGYGRTWINDKGYYAHRVIFDLVNPGVISLTGPRKRSENGHLMHTCDNPVCVNPAHLKVCTHAENMADMRAKGRSHRYQSDRSPRAKLTRGNVIVIRRQKKEGATIKALALLYDVSMSTISGLLYGRHYQDI